MHIGYPAAHVLSLVFGLRLRRLQEKMTFVTKFVLVAAAVQALVVPTFGSSNHETRRDSHNQIARALHAKSANVTEVLSEDSMVKRGPNSEFKFFYPGL